MEVFGHNGTVLCVPSLPASTVFPLIDPEHKSDASYATVGAP